ncbi:MAG: acyltransferase [Candidatus Wallbacteria bacterium]
MLNNNHIHESAKIPAGIKMGFNVIISAEVTIGPGTIIGSNVIIHEGSSIGANVRIDDNTVIGKLPMRAANSVMKPTGELPACIIGDNCIIGANVVIYRGCEIGQKVLIADLATIRENVKIGQFTIIGRGVAVENFCEIGEYVKLETNAYITAYSKIEDRVFIAPNVCTTNDNYLGRTKERLSKMKGITAKKGSRIGGNATILPGVTLNEDALVAAGSVVTRDVPAKKVAMGVPAKIIRDVSGEQLLENQ